MAKFKYVGGVELLESKLIQLNDDNTTSDLFNEDGNPYWYKLHKEYDSVEEGMPKDKHITLPKRQTHKSAGYDFEFPYDDFTLEPGKAILIPTGVCISGLKENEDLELHIRSGRGIFQRLRILNVVGIVDGDYELASNGGNIGIAIINESSVPYTFKFGERFAQGIIRIHGFVEDDCPVDRIRTGGGSSTDR